nr:aspartyl protease family protein [candidate division Zixibacteria bacterium]
MKNIIIGLCLGLIIPFNVAIGDNTTPLSDPYQIMGRYVQAIGGLERLKGEQTSYFEATFTMPGLAGTLKNWTGRPDRERTELDLQVLRKTTGDNGRFSWELDTNGKVTINKDKATLKRREISRLMNEFDFLDPGSNIFDLFFMGSEAIDGKTCYVIRITNSVNNDTLIEYYPVDDFIKSKSVSITPDEKVITKFSDYRFVDGLLIPFCQEMNIQPVGQEIKVQITEYRSDIEIDPALFDPPGEDVRDYRFLSGGASADIPFEYIENHIYLMVNINGRERIWILDTGAQMSVISSRYAREIGVDLEGSMKGSGAGNTVDFSFATLPSYRLGDIEFEPQQVAALDLGEIFDHFDIDVVGILGYDFLSRFITRVDYAGEMLTFYDPDHFEYDGPGVILDAPLHGNDFHIPITVDGRYDGDWNVDLGASTISFHYPYAREHNLQEGRGVDRVGLGAGGEFRERTVQFEYLELAGFRILKPLIDIPMNEMEGAFRSGEMTGNLGNSIMRNFILYLDYKNQKMIVERGKDFGREFPEDKSGLQIWRENGRPVVHFISPGTPGQKAEFQVGDIILSVNKLKVEYLKNLQALHDLFKAAEGTEYNVGIMRDGKERELKIRLKNLY